VSVLCILSRPRLHFRIPMPTRMTPSCVALGARCSSDHYYLSLARSFCCLGHCVLRAEQRNVTCVCVGAWLILQREEAPHRSVEPFSCCSGPSATQAKEAIRKASNPSPCLQFAVNGSVVRSQWFPWRVRNGLAAATLQAPPASRRKMEKGRNARRCEMAAKMQSGKKRTQKSYK